MDLRHVREKTTEATREEKIDRPSCCSVENVCVYVYVHVHVRAQSTWTAWRVLVRLLARAQLLNCCVRRKEEGTSTTTFSLFSRSRSIKSDDEYRSSLSRFSTHAFVRSPMSVCCSSTARAPIGGRCGTYFDRTTRRLGPRASVGSRRRGADLT